MAPVVQQQQQQASRKRPHLHPRQKQQQQGWQQNITLQRGLLVLRVAVAMQGLG
jgi:hypothetical protein